MNTSNDYAVMREFTTRSRFDVARIRHWQMAFGVPYSQVWSGNHRKPAWTQLPVRFRV